MPVGMAGRRPRSARPGRGPTPVKPLTRTPTTHQTRTFLSESGFRRSFLGSGPGPLTRMPQADFRSPSPNLNSRPLRSSPRPPAAETPLLRQPRKSHCSAESAGPGPLSTRPGGLGGRLTRTRTVRWSGPVRVHSARPPGSQLEPDFQVRLGNFTLRVKLARNRTGAGRLPARDRTWPARAASETTRVPGRADSPAARLGRILRGPGA